MNIEQPMWLSPDDCWILSFIIVSTGDKLYYPTAGGLVAQCRVRGNVRHPEFHADPLAGRGNLDREERSYNARPCNY